MPELPEVEFARRLAEAVLVHSRIAAVRCARDNLVYEDSPTRVRRALLDRTVRRVCRHGKYLWFELDRRPWPLLHFGMTGRFRTPETAPLPLESSPRVEPSGWPPRFTKLHLTLDTGRQLVMTNARRLGRIRLRHDPRHEPPVNRLGFDPLHALPPPRAFADLIENRSVSLKGLLLDQKFAAGVGNWIADEVLYQAGLDPRRRANTLGTEEVRRLRQKLGSVVRTAVRVDADKERLPKSWLFHHRWGKRADARTRRGERVEHITVAGRTTAWVPSAQQ